MKALNVEDALKTSDLAETSGPVHLTPANGGLSPNSVCNCCIDYRGPLEGAIRSDVVPMEYAPSRYRVNFAKGLCTGCQTCSEHRPFGVIEMVKALNSEKLKAKVNKEKSKGCGVCVMSCEPGALIFTLAESVEFIPKEPKVQHAGTSHASVK